MKPSLAIFLSAPVTYTGVVSHLMYHLRFANKRSMPEPKWDIQAEDKDKIIRSREQLLKGIRDVYAITATLDSFKALSHDFVFEDPVAKFYGVQELSCVIPVMKKTVSYSDVERFQPVHGENEIYVDMQVKYVVWKMSVTVPSLLSVYLRKRDSGEEEVVRMTEEFYWKPLLNRESSAIMGTCHATVKRFHGIIFSKLFKYKE